MFHTNSLDWSNRFQVQLLTPWTRTMMGSSRGRSSTTPWPCHSRCCEFATFNYSVSATPVLRQLLHLLNPLLVMARQTLAVASGCWQQQWILFSCYCCC
mmetsp:Transcript_55438/g.110173  ORF Transcript_55438/g.110173 Transcript_55438/m.110173 type:complete len:99 (-) Transcript_55438:230-526(-)